MSSCGAWCRCPNMSSVFKEAAAKSKRELVITKGGSSPEASAVENDELDPLFSVSTLNHLVISGFSEFSTLSPKISKLRQLFQLVLTNNTLTSLPSEIGSLSKLKHLDVSGNGLTSIPSSLYSIDSLQTLILSRNNLNDESFPSDVPSECFPNLHHIDLVGNSLTALPVFVYHSRGLLELVAIDNNISTLESSISKLTNLRQADLKRNKLTVLPYELSLCSKLKSLDLVDNPISDRRLLKLVTQHGGTKPKPILDYIASHSPKPASPDKKGKPMAKKKQVSGGTSSTTEDDDGIVFEESKHRLTVVRPAELMEVSVSSQARRVRPYLICAIVRGVDLTSHNNYKKFITLQTKLHEGVCKRRRAATLATHDLAKLSLPLSFTLHSANKMEMTPLGQTTPISVRNFLDELEGSKPPKGGGGGKKGAKRMEADKELDPTRTALSKYLQFVNPMEMVCIRDNHGVIVSLPPLTNSENTKIEPTTTDVWLEVTSTLNLATCKAAMDTLVCEMCVSGVGVASDGVMHVEQVKIMEKGSTGEKLLVLYPSRTDLVNCPSISIERPT